MVNFATEKSTTKAPRRRSRSEGATEAAKQLQESLDTIAPLTRFSMTELYVRTSGGVVFQDENFQRETVAKAERLIETALSPESSERNALIAKKALKYREMRSRRPNVLTGMAIRTQSCPVPR
ncbi:hypothetical protein P3T76_013102 [Phytophthora citrophthora]|uniref:Uncharacterized protein n=1 Tax=Phytophthora citrophthora TaxID=4793 RepID=A0AAD9G405_9STRA|nr:hypothetical protein P3T76_013102 [Phytophthora citrophthora]